MWLPGGSAHGRSPTSRQSINASPFHQVQFVALYMDYYYPTQRDLFEDPFHVGRRDQVYKFTLTFRRYLSKQLYVDIAGRYSQRVVTSPYYGDVSLDKDYDQRRVWVAFNYRF